MSVSHVHEAVVPPVSGASSSSRISGARLEYLDSYRGIACLLVYFYHTAVNISVLGVPFYGYNGVHLFFVLSGYLMMAKFVPSIVGGRRWTSADTW